MEYKGKNWPRIICNAVTIIFKELYIKSLWFLECSCKIMTYPFFSLFQKFWFFCPKIGQKAQISQNDLNAIHIIFCELNIRWFLVYRCKMMISSVMFFDFSARNKFFFLIFGPENVERAKRGLNSLHLCADHFLVTISHMSMLFGRLIQNDEIGRSFS